MFTKPPLPSLAKSLKTEDYFKPTTTLNSAILFLVFSRPDTTQQVFEAIRKAKPPRLYIAADGPRETQENEHKLCQETRRIATEVDWECEVKTLFRDHNLGCRQAVSSAIDWFFDNEDQGIILEDDCLPSQSFFWYCQELLDYYSNDTRIMAISGNNFQAVNSVTPNSYYFSRHNHCWGWATWKRAWKHYDHNMSLWPEFKNKNGLIPWADGSSLFITYWNKIFNTVANERIDSWAYIWTFSCWTQSGLTCLPDKNLVCNIGFDADATHTKKKNNFSLHQQEVNFPLDHPNVVVRNTKADKYTDKYHFRIRFVNVFYSTIKDIFSVKVK